MIRPDELAAILEEELEQLAHEVRHLRGVVSVGRKVAQLLADFDSIAERLEYAKYDGACRIVRAARATFAQTKEAVSPDTVFFLSGKAVEMLNEARAWVTDKGD